MSHNSAGKTIEMSYIFCTEIGRFYEQSVFVHCYSLTASCRLINTILVFLKAIYQSHRSVLVGETRLVRAGFHYFWPAVYCFGAS